MLFQNELYEKVSPWEDWLESQEVIALNDSNLVQLLTAVYMSGVAGIDLETTGLDPLQDEIALVQVAVLRSEGENPENLKATVFVGKPTFRIMENLIEIVENTDVLKILFNAKFDLSFIRASAGRKILPKNVFDVMIASQLVTAGDFIPEAQLEQYLAQNNIKRIKFKQGGTKYFDQHGHEIVFEKDTAKQTRPLYPTHSLQQVAHRYLEVWLDKSMQVSDWTQGLNTDQIKYAAKDALVLLPLYQILDKLIKLNKLKKTAKIEFDCIPAVIEIELAGMPFDVEKAQAILQDVIEGQNLLYQELQKAVPNPNSSVQIQQYLNKFAGPSGIEINGEIFPVNSGDENLSRIASRLPEGHELKNFIRHLQEYRSLKKKSDFLQKWLNLLHPKTKRLHTDLKQINPQGVGRFSARDPNLQQVGRDPEIRKLFRAGPGKSLVIADYGAIEMRIAAQLSKDKTLIKAFQAGVDIHKFTASELSGKPLDQISKEERQASKACFSADTEILTTKSWVRFDEYDGETPVAQFNLEKFDYNWVKSKKLGSEFVKFVKPLAFRSFDNRDLVHYADQNIDLLVTPDHEVIWIDNNHRLRKLRADNINPNEVKYFITASFYKFCEKESFALSEAETRVLDMAATKGKLFEAVPGKHRAYCVQVPSGAVVVRRNGKVVICGNCNFGLIYGMASKTLQLYAETGYGVKMTVEEAQQARESFFKTYPGIERWHRKQMHLVSEKGFSDYWTYKFGQGFVKEKRPAVRTLSGRLRVWPVERSAFGALKKIGPVTEAFNTPDQGTGADIIKLALALLYEELVDKNIDAAIIGCVHDEILLEVPVDSAGTIQVLELNMLKAAQTLLPNVPVEIEAHACESWAEK